MKVPQDADLPSALLAGSAWFWGARLAAGALLALGCGPRAASALAWLGVAGAGWAIAPLAAAGAWRRAAGAVLLIALPEAIATVSGRLTSAGVIGLRVPLTSVLLGSVGQVLVTAVLLAVAALLVHAAPRALTSARRRFPT